MKHWKTFLRHKQLSICVKTDSLWKNSIVGYSEKTLVLQMLKLLCSTNPAQHMSDHFAIFHSKHRCLRSTKTHFIPHKLVSKVTLDICRMSCLPISLPTPHVSFPDLKLLHLVGLGYKSQYLETFCFVLLPQTGLLAATIVPLLFLPN